MLFNTNTKSESIHLRVTKLQKDELQKVANDEGLTLTKFILKCIDYYLKNNNN